jgi:hypothetical protein
LGLEFVEQSGDEGKKAIRGLAFEDDSVGEHAMLQSVLGGVEFSGLSDRAVGFGAVFAGCLLLPFCAHMPILEHLKRARACDGGSVLLIQRGI